MPTEMPVGSCSCGAVYAYDATGHNLGAAMIEALVFGCKGDWDLAWNLLPEQDYLENRVAGYDFENHLIIHSSVYQGKRISGILYFLRLHQDVREITEGVTKPLLRKTTPPFFRSSEKQRGKKSFSKKQVEEFVRQYELAALIDIAKEDKRIIRDLQRLIYSVDRLLRWRATEALGKVSAVISKYDPGAISKLLERLFSAVTDTAASSWGSLDAIGEIICNGPEQFAGYIPQLYQLARDRALLPEVLRALERISGRRPDLIRKKAFYFVPLLRDPNPEIRGHAVLLLGNLRAREARANFEALLNDSTRVEIYRNGTLGKHAIGQLASGALQRL